MYISAETLLDVINSLKKVHPFYGITYLACKQNQLPIGKTTSFQMDACTNDFLIRHHNLAPESRWFFQPYKSVKHWLRHDYAASGLQAINTQTFGPAFLHASGSRIWGWSENYIEYLKSKLINGQLLPGFALAVWVYKQHKWPNGTLATDIIEKFKLEFCLSPKDAELFDFQLPQGAEEKLFEKEPITWSELRKALTPPPDSKPDQGGTLTYLEISDLGPAKLLLMSPAKRLSLITGDNGLGKTFILECAWWALTGAWAGAPAYPRLDSGQKRVNSQISFTLEGEHNRSNHRTILFDWNTLSWPEPKKRPTIPGLTVYARVDGSFAVWDPAKQVGIFPHKKAVFTSLEVWDGLSGQIEGLIRDWVRWQNTKEKSPFNKFTKILERLSPPDLGLLTPGEPVRVPGDPRDIPTISHPHGITPIIYCSAGVKRIITLAYLIVWSWNEHLIAAELSGVEPEKRMVVLIDEMEAHLHPKWQREVLPSLMSIGEVLNESLETQFIVATHSPLVMASAEPIFNEDIDTLFHLEMQNNGKVQFSDVDFQRYGDISSWLTSPIFELKHARSREAEVAIEEAKKLQLSQDTTREDVKDLTGRLIKYLGPEDKFWPRWIAFAEKFGIDL